MTTNEVAWQEFLSKTLESACTALGKRKRYASFWWNFPDKPTKERGIVCDLLESIEAEGRHHGIMSVRKNASDPPDCVGTMANGELVAFELSELVDQQTVERNERGQRVWKEWSANGFVEKVRGILKEKDRRSFDGGPYARVVLVIHTDEPLLHYADCEAILRGESFGPCKHITDAYLLFSYVFEQEAYAFLPLRIESLSEQVQAINLSP